MPWADLCGVCFCSCPGFTSVSLSCLNSPGEISLVPVKPLSLPLSHNISLSAHPQGWGWQEATDFLSFLLNSPTFPTLTPAHAHPILAGLAPSPPCTLSRKLFPCRLSLSPNFVTFTIPALSPSQQDAGISPGMVPGPPALGGASPEGLKQS